VVSAHGRQFWINRSIRNEREHFGLATLTVLGSAAASHLVTAVKTIVHEEQLSVWEGGGGPPHSRLSTAGRHAHRAAVMAMGRRGRRTSWHASPILPCLHTALSFLCLGIYHYTPLPVPTTPVILKWYATRAERVLRVAYAATTVSNLPQRTYRTFLSRAHTPAALHKPVSVAINLLQGRNAAPSRPLPTAAFRLSRRLSAFAGNT